MALFPEAKLTVLVPSGGMVPGTRAEGALELRVPEPIPRADHVHVFFRTQAIAGYGSGKQRRVYRRDLFVAPLELKLDRHRPLAAGTYSYPFAFDLPPWLPPGYGGSDCSIVHSIEARLDVDWAIDPKTTVMPLVLMAPTSAAGQPMATRSPAGFHDQLVLDLTLDTNCIVAGQPLTGQIGVRAGHEARFDAVTIAIASMATILMGRGDRRRGHGSMIRIPAEHLRSGQSVPFAVHYDPKLVPPTFRNGFIDHDVFVVVEADIPWATDPSFSVPIHVVPFGSQVHHVGQGGAPVGNERLLRLAAAMAQATGFAPGRLPTLVEGKVGPVRVVVTDSPREGTIGLDIAFEYPDIELETVFRPLGMLEGFRQSPLLPAPISDEYFLRVEPAIPVAEEALKAFFATLVGGFQPRTEIRLSDHRLAIHHAQANDGGEAMVELARWTRARAETIAAAIASLPFAPSHAVAAPAWIATAAEQNAFLLPHVPALHGIVLSTRIVGGEQRALGVNLHTRNDGTIAAELDLRSSPLPRAAWAELEKGAELPGLRGVRAVFPHIAVHSLETVTLEGAPFAPDPRVLLSPIEQFFGWLLEARGERRTDAPYR